MADVMHGGRGRRLVTAALFAATFLVSLDAAVVSTAMPTVVGQLGGISLYTWVFSAYLLSSTVTMPIYGKLADVYGRKPVIVASILIFLGGSVLCGQARSMEQLIIFRVIQGIGAGGVQPLTQTVLGDIYSLAARARISGVLSAIWGISGVLGPAVGGVLTEYVSWRAVFYVNAPICFLTLFLIWRFLQENIQRRKHAIDVQGAILLTLSVSSLLFGLEGKFSLGGLPVSAAWLYGLAVLFLAAFIWQERRAAEPILPLAMFRSRLVVGCSLGAGAGGMLLNGHTAFVPPLVQGVLGGSPTVAGLVLAANAVSWPVASSLVGWFLMRIGFRAPAILGGVLATLAALMLWRVAADSGLWLPVSAELVTGLGFGFFLPLTTIAVQNAVSWEERGVATAINMFARSIGGSIGVAAAGTVFAAGMANVASGVDPNALLSGAGRASLDAATLAEVQETLMTALHGVFGLMVGVGLLGILALALLPGGRPVARASRASERDEKAQERSAAGVG